MMVNLLPLPVDWSFETIWRAGMKSIC